MMARPGTIAPEGIFRRFCIDVSSAEDWTTEDRRRLNDRGTAMDSMPAVDSPAVASQGAAAHNVAEETHNPARSPGVGNLGAHNPTLVGGTRETEGYNRPAARNTPAAVDNRQVRSKASDAFRTR